MGPYMTTETTTNRRRPFPAHREHISSSSVSCSHLTRKRRKGPISKETIDDSGDDAVATPKSPMKSSEPKVLHRMKVE